MSGSLMLPLAASFWDPDALNLAREHGVKSSAAASSDPPRAVRLHMEGTGYRATLDDETVSLTNLSLSGVLVRSQTSAVPGPPMIFKIGWPQDRRGCAAIGRVRWVRFDPAKRQEEATYRIGLAFETWDVRRLMDIVGHCRQAPIPLIEAV
jgi:hypothetical protein